LLIRALQQWHAGVQPLADIAVILRDALLSDPPALLAANLLALRTLLRYQPSLRRSDQEESDGRLKVRAQHAGWSDVATETLQACIRANDGNSVALMVMGVAMDFVVGNIQEGLRYYRMAAERGFAPAQHNLGLSYALGDGVEQNDAQAHSWYTESVS
jgi:TPR repeat protein